MLQKAKVAVISICSTALIISLNSFIPFVGEPFANPPASTEQKIFLPGIVSDGLPNRDMAISPSMDEMFYTLQQRGGSISVIMHAKFKDGKWTVPSVASFSGMYTDLEPAFSPDGKTLYFSSKRISGDTLARNFDIWKVTRASNGWSTPERLPDNVNTNKDEFYPSIAKSGNLYFTRDAGESKEDIFVTSFQNGTYLTPTQLPSAINSAGYEFNAFVDPDEQYLIFTGFRRKDDMGGGDLYISRKNGNEWVAAENMGAGINSTSLDYCPFVSPDKNFLFYTSSRNILKQPFSAKKSKQQIEAMLSGAGNGFDDIYWTRFK